MDEDEFSDPRKDAQNKKKYNIDVMEQIESDPNDELSNNSVNM